MTKYNTLLIENQKRCFNENLYDLWKFALVFVSTSELLEDNIIYKSENQIEINDIYKLENIPGIMSEKNIDEVLLKLITKAQRFLIDRFTLMLLNYNFEFENSCNIIDNNIAKLKFWEKEILLSNKNLFELIF